MNTSPFYAGVSIGNKVFTQIYLYYINKSMVYYSVGHEHCYFKHSLLYLAACSLPNGFLSVGRGNVCLLFQ